MTFGSMTQKFQIMRKTITCSLATQKLHIQAITTAVYFANINVPCELDVEEQEALRIEPLPDNL
jgi:hypothetical protein